MISPCCLCLEIGLGPWHLGYISPVWDRKIKELFLFWIIKTNFIMQMATPLTMIEGHKKAVSYVRFLGPNRLVSASTDNKLKLWDIDAAISGQGPSSLVNTFSGILLNYLTVLSSFCRLCDSDFS